jgi:3-phosphoshikimate 1-carboxyvinyltransferase
MDIEDHRVAMSAAVGALTASRPSVIANVDCVSKSYPAFWSDLTDLGARFGERP